MKEPLTIPECVEYSVSLKEISCVCELVFCLIKEQIDGWWNASAKAVSPICVMR